MRIEVLLDLKTRLGESPVWDVEQQRLWWVDSLDGRLFACNAQGGAIKSWDVRQKIGSFALRQSGEGAVVALQNGVHLLDFASGELTLLHHPEADRPFNRLNDGKVDRQGRFLFGSMDMREEEPSGALYRLDADLSLHVLKKGIIVSNAPCWSPSGDTFYFADTWTGEICAGLQHRDRRSFRRTGLLPCRSQRRRRGGRRHRGQRRLSVERTGLRGQAGALYPGGQGRSHH